MHGVNDVSDVRQREIHTAQPLVPEPSAFDIELAIEKPKIPKSPGIVQITAELIKAGVEQFDMRFINLLFLFGIRRNCLRSGRSQSLYLSIRRAIKQTVVIIGAYHYVQNFIQHPTVKVNSTGKGNYWGSLVWNFNATGQLLIMYFTFIKYLRKNGNITKQCVSSL